jgi:hypothetical protein
MTQVAGQRRGDWMQTYSGRQFWPVDPRADEIDIVDIAHALSMQCRFAGHCLKFYSVAEHSVHLSHVVPPEDALWALLHDASEAYLTDVVRPLKPFLSGYGEAEDAVMRAVCDRFRLPHEVPASVKIADGRILADEAAQNMAAPPVAWVARGAPLGIQLRYWRPDMAKVIFLERFVELTKGSTA